MKRKRLFLVALSVTLAGCGEQVAPPARIEQPVLTQVVGASASAGSFSYSGEVRARHETALGFRIGGKIVARLVDAGAAVKAGQVLARLDPADAALQASQAEAQWRLAEDEAKRFRDLRSSNFISQSALDAKETALKAAQAQAGLARNQAAYTRLLADHDGVITAVLAEPGQVVSAGQPVFRLAQKGEREVAISVPESQVGMLKIGAPAEVTLWVGDTEAAPLQGRLRELAPAADPASRTYPARVALTDANMRWALGMTARVRFTGGAGDASLILPLSAIFQQGDQPAVWIVAADHSVQLRPVKVTAYRDDGALIGSGLAAGERIVSAGVHKLTAGEKIRPIEAASTR